MHQIARQISWCIFPCAIGHACKWYFGTIYHLKTSKNWQYGLFNTNLLAAIFLVQDVQVKRLSCRVLLGPLFVLCGCYVWKDIQIIIPEGNYFLLCFWSSELNWGNYNWKLHGSVVFFSTKSYTLHRFFLDWIPTHMTGSKCYLVWILLLMYFQVPLLGSALDLIYQNTKV